jgi:hypothetical protein
MFKPLTLATIALAFSTSYSVSAHAGCATNRNTGVVICMAHMGCATNENTGVVICDVGQCAHNRNTGVVLCANTSGGGAAANANTGQVLCTTDDGVSNLSPDNCIVGRYQPN